MQFSNVWLIAIIESWVRAADVASKQQFFSYRLDTNSTKTKINTCR